MISQLQSQTSYIIIAILIVLSLVTFSILVQSKRRQRHRCILNSQLQVEPSKASLYSPEYRCSTKCFDCVNQRSSEFWQESHPAKMFAGM